jgi:hypothetical protein
MAIWYKQGVYGELILATSEGLRKVEKLFAKYGLDVFVTSKRDGSHMPGSFHPHGRAFDIRKHHKITKTMLKKALGDNFDVVEHKTHFHIEHDPKNNIV